MNGTIVPALHRVPDRLPHDWFWTCDGLDYQHNPMPVHHEICMKLYVALGEALRPKTIFEVGVRYGYSLGALMLGAKPSAVHGIDNESYVPGSLKSALGNLARLSRAAGLDTRITLNNGDSKTYPFPRGYDLYHIDGVHDYEGAKSDIEKAVEAGDTGSVIVVDDCHEENHPGVWKACMEHWGLLIDKVPGMEEITHKGTYLIGVA